MNNSIIYSMTESAKAKCRACRERFFGRRSPGIDGILVTIGLCIIALVLCVLMKEQISSFISTLVSNMTSKAQSMLNN